MAVVSPAVVACGDVVGVAFEGEDEAVLFVPNSGDVLISELGQWLRLTGHATIAEVEQSFSLDAGATKMASASGANDLRATLLQLGVKLD